MKKMIIGFLLGGIIFGTIGVVASTTISSKNVTYQNKTVNNALDELYNEAITGKELVAAAITNKGINTTSNDTYETMAANINSIDTDNSEINQKINNLESKHNNDVASITGSISNLTQNLAQLSANGNISFLIEDDIVYFCFNGKKGVALYYPFKNSVLSIISAEASSIFNSSWKVSNSYDNNLNTAWLSSNTSSVQSITFDLGSEKPVYKVDLVLCHSHSQGTGTGSITFYGSNDNSNFKKIAYVDNVTYLPYPISSDSSSYMTLYEGAVNKYRYFKLELDSGTASPGIKNIRFYE